VIIRAVAGIVLAIALAGPALAWPCLAFCAADTPVAADCHESTGGPPDDRLTSHHDCSAHTAPAALSAWPAKVNVDFAFGAVANMHALPAPSAGDCAASRDTSPSARPPSLTAIQVPLRL